MAAIILTGGLAARFALQARPSDDAREAYAEAQDHLKKNDLRAARIALMNAVKADPKWSDVLIAQAQVSLDLFDSLAAQSALEKAVAAGVPKASVAHLLGQSYWMQGDLDRAMAVLADPDIPGANRAYANRIMGRIQLEKGDFAASQAAFDEAVRLAPKDSMVWTDLARLRFVSADQKGAIEAVDYALTLDANNVRAIEFRARLMRSQFGLVAALPWFERGLQIDGSDVPLLGEYALTLGEVGRNADMLTVARKIISLDGGNARAFYMQAIIAARAGNCDLAKRVLPRAGAKFNELPGPMLLDAICEYELGNFNRSIDQFQRLLAMQPRNLTVRTLLAQAMYRAGNPLDALDVIRPIAERADADSYSLMLAARAFEASGQRDRATGALDDAVRFVLRPSLPFAEIQSLSSAAEEARHAPDDARIIVPYIRALMASGDLDTAIAEATRLQAGNQGVADAHILVGDVEAARGNLPQAVTAYQQARAISFTEPVMLRLVDGLERSGDAKGAGETLAAYLAFNPTSLAGQRLAGYRALDAGDWKNAVLLLERVRSRVGNNDGILLANLARGYSGAGQHDAAIREAAAAYRIVPANFMVTHVYGQVLLKSGKRPKAAVELLEKAVILMPDNVGVARELRQARLAFRNS
ncbi:MAG: tetratricopeptide repeat protein [Sphingorhabdus sp.]